jgi:hypothetical protein
MHPISGRKKWFVFARNVFNTRLEILIIFILEAGCMLLGNSKSVYGSCISPEKARRMTLRDFSREISREERGGGV